MSHYQKLGKPDFADNVPAPLQLPSARSDHVHGFTPIHSCVFSPAAGKQERNRIENCIDRIVICRISPHSPCLLLALQPLQSLSLPIAKRVLFISHHHSINPSSLKHHNLKSTLQMSKKRKATGRECAIPPTGLDTAEPGKEYHPLSAGMCQGNLWATVLFCTLSCVLNLTENCVFICMGEDMSGWNWGTLEGVLMVLRADNFQKEW